MSTSYITAPGMDKAPDYSTDAVPVPENTANSGDLWSGLGAAGWGALNSALFNVPEYLVKNIAPSDTYKALKDLEARNQGAYTAGQIAGMFAPTGGILAKGAGLGLKGAKVALEAAKVGKLADVVGEGAKALDTAGDIIRGGKAVSGIGGGIARGALSAAEQAIPRAAMAVTEGEDPGTAGSEALKATALGGALGGGIGALGKARDLISKYAPEVTDLSQKAILNRVGVSPRAIRQGITGMASESEIPQAAQDLINTYGRDVRQAAAQTVIANKATAPANFKPLGRLELPELTAAVQKANPDIAPEVATMAAKSIRNAVGVGEIATGGGAGFVGALTRNPLITGALTGGGLSAGKDLLKGQAPSTSTLQNALLGAAAVKYGPRILAQAAPALEKLAGTELPGIVGKVAPAVSEALVKAPGILGVESSPEDRKAIEKIKTSEAQTTPAGQEQAKYQISEKYAQKIADNVQQAWLTKYAALGVPYEDFVRALAKRTDNFDPSKSAAILFPDKTDRAKFLKDYDTALKLQGMNIEAAYKGKGANKLTEFFGGGNAAEAKMAYDNLVDTAAGASAAPGSLPSAAERKAVEDDLDQIMALPASAGPKRDILLKKLADKYGLSLTTLQDLGLV